MGYTCISYVHMWSVLWNMQRNLGKQHCEHISSIHMFFITMYLRSKHKMACRINTYKFLAKTSMVQYDIWGHIIMLQRIPHQTWHLVSHTIRNYATLYLFTIDVVAYHIMLSMLCDSQRTNLTFSGNIWET